MPNPCLHDYLWGNYKMQWPGIYGIIMQKEARAWKIRSFTGTPAALLKIYPLSLQDLNEIFGRADLSPL